MGRASGFCLEVYWGEFGTLGEGRMEDPRRLDVNRKPTRAHMDEIYRAMKAKAKELGLVGKRKR